MTIDLPSARCLKNILPLLLCLALPAALAAPNHGGMVHPALADLMAHTKMTHQAQQSGNWTNPATWGGSLPPSGARVLIPMGVTVTVDGQITARLKHVRVDGKLRFATNKNTELRVETLATWPGSTLEIGTASSPVQQGKTARILLIDLGLLNINEDYELLGRAVIPQGKVRIFGSAKTTWRQANGWLPTGSSTVTLQSAPSNWQVGDRIVMSGTKCEFPSGGYTNEFEVFTVAGISGSTVTLDRPTTKERTVTSSHPAFQGQYPYVANYTRNVIIESENKASIPRRGHLMFMHTQDVVMKYAQLEELGRTDKSIPFVRTADLQSATDNSIARYAMHFHRAGDLDQNATFGEVEGCALWGSPGWGYVNHESSVWFRNNASFGVFGSHFTDENGTELGGFIGNIAIYSIGSSQSASAASEKTRERGDHGHTGVGFWATGGPTVRWEDNVATDHNMAGYAIVTRRMPEDAHEAYDLSLHSTPNIGGGSETARPAHVGINFFRNNVSHLGNRGLVIVDLELNGRLNTENYFEGFTVFNPRRQGLQMQYTRNLTFKDTKIIRDDGMRLGSTNGGLAVEARGTWDHFFAMETKGYTVLDNVTIYGFIDGFDLQRSNATDAEQDSRLLIYNNCEINLSGVLADNMSYVTQNKPVGSMPDRPVVSVPGGTYNGAFDVTLQAESGATIYYVTAENYGHDIRSVSLPLKPTNAYKYNGETIRINKEEEIIFAIAVKNGISSRPMVAFYGQDAGGGSPTTVPVTGVSINGPGSIQLTEGDDHTLSHTISPQNATQPAASYTSSNTNVAQVTNQGVVLGVSAGTATVTVTTQDGGFTDQITVNVQAAPSTGGHRYVRVRVTATNTTEGRMRLNDFRVGNGTAWHSVSGGLWDNLSVLPTSRTLDLGAGNAISVSEYDVHTVYNETRTPRNFVIEGSSDQSSWTVIEQVTGRGSSAYQSNQS
ncbi:MAG: G8 domain-containing protein, partial [Catalinimonas sp.]